jgi:phage shock protein A
MNNIIDDALNQIRVVWDNIQPQYRDALEEMNTWQQVAFKALQNNREDLAREALKRKKKYEQKARELEKELEKLAFMTENLLKNHLNS